jgi:hypothetical protein
MGYTRARRYANHASGRKYSSDGGEILPRENDPVKAESARIFYDKWQKAKQDRGYQRLMQAHREAHETSPAPAKPGLRTSQSRRARGATPNRGKHG